MEGGVSTAAGAWSIRLGLSAVNHASGSSDWLDGRSQDARLLPPADVNHVAADSDGSSFHALTCCHWTAVHCWNDGGQYLRSSSFQFNNSFPDDLHCFDTMIGHYEEHLDCK